MKRNTLVQGLKRISLFRPLVISFESLECSTRWGPANRPPTNFPGVHRASHMPVSSASLARPQLTATNRERPEWTSTGNRLTIMGSWIAPLIAWLIAVGMSLAIAAVAVLNSE
jgi:hypothetical protein